MTVRYRDYDAAFAEANREAPPIVIRLFGQDWELPGDLPASVVVRLTRMMADGRSEDELSVAEQMTLAMDVIPAEVLDAWLAKGLDTDQLAVILLDVVSEYGAQLDDPSSDSDGGEGPEGSAPETGDTPSSNSSSPTGPLSRPTSPASTPPSGRFQLR